MDKWSPETYRSLDRFGAKFGHNIEFHLNNFEHWNIAFHFHGWNAIFRWPNLASKRSKERNVSAKSRQEQMEKMNTVQETVKFKGPLNVLPKTMTHVTRKAMTMSLIWVRHPILFRSQYSALLFDRYLFSNLHFQALFKYCSSTGLEPGPTQSIFTVSNLWLEQK